MPRTLRTLALLVALGGCGGSPPEWLEGVDFDGLDTRTDRGDFIVRGVSNTQLSERLTQAGWRSWRPSQDENLPAGFETRWQRGEDWALVGTPSARHPDHWTLRRAPSPKARPIPDTPSRLGTVLTRGRSAALTSASMCTTGAGGVSLALRLDGGFAMGGNIDGKLGQVDGSWSLRGAGLVFEGTVVSDPRKPAYTSKCEDLVVLGTDHTAQVVHCRNQPTWFCSVPPGQLITVTDAGAGAAGADHVARALAREDRPPDGGVGLDGVLTLRQVFRAEPSPERPEGVVVRYREDRDQAERFAYRLNRDLELYDVRVERWEGAPTPFVVEVGGQVRVDGEPPPPAPPVIPEIDFALGFELPDPPAVFALVDEGQTCSWSVAGVSGEPVEIARSPTCPIGLVLGDDRLVAQFEEVLIERRWPGQDWSVELVPAGTDGCEIPFPTSGRTLRQICIEDDAGSSVAVLYERPSSGGWSKIRSLPVPSEEGPSGARVFDDQRGAHEAFDLARAPQSGLTWTPAEAETVARLSKQLERTTEAFVIAELSRGVLVAQGTVEAPTGPVSWCPTLARCDRASAWEIAGPFMASERERHVLFGAPQTGATAVIFKPPDTRLVDLPSSVRAAWIPEDGLPGF